jgi:hypothetical protein
MSPEQAQIQNAQFLVGDELVLIVYDNALGARFSYLIKYGHWLSILSKR